MTDHQAKLMWLHRPKRKPVFHGPWPKFWALALLLATSLASEGYGVALNSQTLGGTSCFAGFAAMVALRRWCFDTGYTIEKS